ncbi:MAG: hypothetical protein LBQ24_07230 [Candidatus Peribacteria bacterium]|nr:hypothetical protein [Candidatus Peribacteria bacterium]
MVKKDTIENIIDYISKFKDAEKFMIKAPLNKEFNSFDELKKEILDLGFIRFSVQDKIYTVNDDE